MPLTSLIPGRHRSRLFLLLSLLALQTAAASFLWSRTEAPIIRGYLVKSGNQYIVAWKRRGHFIESRSCNTLPDALRYARRALHLVTGPSSQRSSEQVTMTRGFGGYRIFFRRAELGATSHLTFRRRRDALFFANAFRRGDYSTSPLGHSIHLNPLSIP